MIAPAQILKLIFAMWRKLAGTWLWAVMTWLPEPEPTKLGGDCVPPAPTEPARDLWYPGSSAFWLDPNLFWPVEDPHRDMCWMLLDQRPAPPKVDPLWPVRSVNGPQVTSPSYRAGRDKALAMLSEANAYERDGHIVLAAMLRDRAAGNLRSVLNTETMR